MTWFKSIIDFFTLGSSRPVLRLFAYYTVLTIVVVVLFRFVPFLDRSFAGEHVEGVANQGASMLQDGLASGKTVAVTFAADSRLELALTTILIMVSTLALMLPVSWVYMSAHGARYDQGVVQTMIILPLVVAGIVLVVRTSVALAFSLAGIVAGLRFRTTMRDVRDTVYVFLGIGVGIAAGVQVLTVAAVMSICFNFLVLMIWRYDFGRNVLEPTAASQWSVPLGDLADKSVPGGAVPDRDLVLALSPKRAAQLAKRFDRVRKILGESPKKPRFNAVLSVTTNTLSDAQSRIEVVLNTLARRWRLDQVKTNEAKPSELYYLVGIRKSVTRDQLLTAIRSSAGDKIIQANLEIGDAIAIEKEESA